MKNLKRKQRVSKKAISSSAGAPAGKTTTSLILALEPRIMFDAAVGASVDQILDNSNNPTTSFADQSQAGNEAHESDNSPSKNLAPLADSLSSNANIKSASVKEIAFVDPRVRESEILLRQLKPGVEVVVLDPLKDGILQMTEYIQAQKDVSAIHVLSHGVAGSITVADTILTAGNIDQYGQDFAGWRAALTQDADILLYSCDLASTAEGKSLVDHLATLTGADVAASTNPTGTAAKGGDWTLEYANGPIEAKLALTDQAMAGYDALMAAPINTVPSARTVAEDNTITFSAGAGTTISIADADGGSLTSTISVTNGTLTLAQTTGLTFNSGGNATAAMSITGTIANINSALDGLVYRPTMNYSGADTLTIATNDGSTTDTDTVAITVTANETAPVLTLPTVSQAVAEDVATYLNFTGGSNAIILTDADANDLQTLVLSVANGTILVKTDVASGITSATGNNSASVTLMGTAAQLSATLSHAQGVQYTADLNYNSSKTGGTAEALTFALSDGVGAHNKSGTVSINVTPVNDAPTFTGAVAATVLEGGSVGLSRAQLAVSDNALDVDIQTGQQVINQLMLKIDSLPVAGALTYKNGPVVIGAVVPVSDLANLKYIHNGTDLMAVGTDSFNVTVSDGGGGSTADVINININPVNIAPTVSGSPTLIEGQVKVVAPTISLGDAFDTLANSTIVIDNIVNGGQGTLFIDANNNNVVDAGEALVGSVTLNAAQRANLGTQLKFFQNGAEPNTPGAIAPSYRVTVTDAGGGTGVPSAPVAATITLTVDANNDDPTLTNTSSDVGSALNVTEGTKTTVLTAAMLQILDNDRNPGDLAETTPENQLVFTIGTRPTQGEIQLNIGGGVGPEGDGWIVLGDGGRFTQADITAGNVRYYQTTNVADGAATPDSFTFTVRDSAFGYDVWTNPAVPTSPREGGLRATPTGAIATQSFFFNINPLATNTTPRDVDVDPPGGDGYPGGYNGDPRPATPGYGGANMSYTFASGNVTDGNNAAVWNEANVDAVGGGYVITQSMLKYTITRVDNNGTPLDTTDDISITMPTDETVYTLTSPPSNGTVQRYIDGSWNTIVTNGQFTQADINSNLIRFVHDGSENHTATFGYQISDGTPNHYDSTFAINVTPSNDRPTGSGGSVPVNEKSIDVNPLNDGLVRLGSAVLGMSDVDLSLDAAKQVGEGAQDFPWFTVLSQPTDSGATQHGILQRWDGDSWETVTIDQWLPSTLLTVVPTDGSGLTSGLRYAHDGSEPLSYPDAPQVTFTYAVRDDLANPGDPYATSIAAVTLSDGSAQSNQSADVTATIQIIPINNAPAVADKPGDADPTITATITGGGATTGVNEVLTNVSEGGSATITSAFLTAIDKDNTTVQRQFKITSAPTLGSLQLNGKTLGVGSTFTQKDIDDNLLTYRHGGTEVVAATTDALGTYNDKFHFTVSDGVDDDTGTGAPNWNTFLITLTPRNDQSTLAAPATLDVFASGATPVAVPGVSVTDPDLAAVTDGESDFLRIEVQTLDAGNNLIVDGVVTYTGADPAGGNAYISGKGTNSLIIQGTQEQVNTALSTLTVAFTGDKDASDLKLRIIADDRLYDNAGNLIAGAGAGANGGLGTLNADGTTIDATNNRVTKDITLRASNVNDVPTITNASAYSVNEDLQLTLAGFDLSDVDSFGQDVTVTVRLYSDIGRTTLANAGTEGKLILGAVVGLTSSSGSNTNTLTLTGTLTNVQTALNLIKFQGAADYNGPGLCNGTLYLRTTITDFNHADGSQTATVDNNVAIVPVNDVPTLSVPGAQVMSSGAFIDITSGFSVGDTKDIAQGANDYIEVTVAATKGGSAYGTLHIVTPGAATVTNDNTDTIVVKGTTADVTLALNALRYTPTAANVDDVIAITVTADDRSAGVGNGKEFAGGVDGNNTVIRNFNIMISGTNDAPVITRPATASVNEDASFTFSGVNVISFADTDDFGASNLNVTLDIPAGTGTLTPAAGSGATITGSGTVSVSITGTKTQINNALNGLVYTPTADYHGDIVLTVVANDAGNTGAGVAQTDTQTVAITVNSINDRPSSSSNMAIAAFTEDAGNPAGTTITSAVLGYSDTSDNQSGKTGGGDTATLMSNIAVVGSTDYVAGQGTWQFSDGSGGWIAITAGADYYSTTNALIIPNGRDIRFVSAANYHGTPGTLQIRVADSNAALTASTASTDRKDLTLGANGSLGSATGSWSDTQQNISTTVDNVNDAPVATGSSTLTSVAEDTAEPAGDTVSNLFTARYSDATDNQTGITGGANAATAFAGIAITANGANSVTEGKWQYNTGGGWTDIPTAGLADATALVLPTTADLRFKPNILNWNGNPGGLTVRLSDGTGFAASANSADLKDLSVAGIGTTGGWSSATIPLSTTVAPVNDAPTLALGGGAANAYTEDASAVVLATAATVTDVELDAITNWSGATLTLARNGGANAQDVFEASGTLAALVQTGNLTVGGTTIGTVTTNSAGTLLLTFNASATNALVTSALNQIAFRNTDQTLGEGATSNLTLKWDINDGNVAAQGTGGALHATATQVITMTGVNDLPTAVGVISDVTQADSTVVNLATAAAFTDKDSDNTFDYTVSGLPAGLIIDSSTGAITGTLDHQASQGGASGVYTIVVTATDSQGAAITQTFTFTVTNPAPVAHADTGVVNENATLTVAAANGVILSGSVPGGVDADVDGDTLSVIGVKAGTAADVASVGTANVASSLLGTYGHLTLNSDGSYSYIADTAAADALGQGVTATDTFSYAISDGNGGESFTTLTITITGPMMNANVNDNPWNGGNNNYNPWNNGNNDNIAQTSLSEMAEKIKYNQLIMEMPENSRELFLLNARKQQDLSYYLYPIIVPSSQEIIVDEVATFSLPTSVFKATDSGAKIKLEATLADDNPLPGWLKFDPDNGRFTGRPPIGSEGVMDIKVTAKDGRGNEASVQFLLRITDSKSLDSIVTGENKTAEYRGGKGRQSFAEQIASHKQNGKNAQIYQLFDRLQKVVQKGRTAA